MNNSSFFENVDLDQALNAFIDAIHGAQVRGATPEFLSSRAEEKKDALAQDYNILKSLAEEGLENVHLLNAILRNWAEKEAYALLLLHEGAFINAADAGLQRAFNAKLATQYQSLRSELLLAEKRAQQKREEAEKSWRVEAYEAFKDQRNQQQQWQTTAFEWVQHQQQMNQQWFQHEQDSFRSYQQANQKWAEIAQVGVQQAHLGLEKYYDFAARTQASVEQMLTGTEQRQSEVVGREIRKANTQRWLTKLFWIGIVLAVTFGGCSVAFFLATNLTRLH